MNALSLIRQIISSLEDRIARWIKEKGIEKKIDLQRPPLMKYGDIACPVFKIAKSIGANPVYLAEELAEYLRKEKFDFVEKIEVYGGYVNIFLDREKVTAKVLSEVLTKDQLYGCMEQKLDELIIVEHTSTNPNAPIHIGNLRNSLLGDAFANILSALGYRVRRHFYVNDMGRQVIMTAIGYFLLKERNVKSALKHDLWTGIIYAIMNNFISAEEFKEKIWKIRPDLKELSQTKYQISDDEEKVFNEVLEREHKRVEDILGEDVESLKRTLKDIVEVSRDLKKRFPEIFNILLEEASKIESLSKYLEEQIRAYERGENPIKMVVRDMCSNVIKEVKKTLSRYGIYFDSFDWESDLAWSGFVEEILKKLEESGFVISKKSNGGEVKILDIEGYLRSRNLKSKLGIKEEFEVPPLVLTRSDGTTLYTTRDIAYTVWKFDKMGAKKVYNVIATEQNLPQLQLNVALRILGYDEWADNLIHFKYELVHLTGMKMSGRRARYITADEVLDTTINEVLKILEKSNYSEEEKRKIAQKVAIGAIKFALLNVSPLKVVTFDIKKALDLKENTGPFVQYNYARICSILRKAGTYRLDPSAVQAKWITGDLEWDLIRRIDEFPEVLKKVVQNLKPELLTNYLNELAVAFSKFYEKVPVLRAENDDQKVARLALVKAVGIVLRNGLKLLGIEAPEKM